MKPPTTIAPGGAVATRLVPLAQRNRRGQLYERLPAVETQIRGALAAEIGRLLERAEVRDHQAPDYLSEECLVYLIRHYYRDEREVEVNELSRFLLRRCAKKINSYLQSLESEPRQEAFRDVVAALFERVLDVESDRGDFLQVRFWVWVERQAITIFNRYRKEAQRARQTLRFSELAGEDSDVGDDDGAPRASAVREGVVAPGISPEERALLQAALATLKDHHREVLVLRYLEGWQIDSIDPNEPTLSKHFGKTEKTIRNWLRHAEAALVDWKERGV